MRIIILLFLYCSASSGIIYSKSILKLNNLKIEILKDAHYLGSKEQNITQLNYFLSSLERVKSSTHLIIESKFFYIYDINYGLDCFYQKLSHLLNSNNNWSFANSPQDLQATTWIAWELPHCLVCKNLDFVTYEFPDPRLELSSRIATQESIEYITNIVEQKYENIKNNLSTKTQECLRILLEQQSNSNLEIYDKVIALKILSIIDAPENNTAKIVVICGGYHGVKLEKLLLNIGFENILTAGLSIADIMHYEKGAELSNTDMDQLDAMFGASARSATRIPL